MVEVTSPQSRGNDLETKVDLYHAAKVPLYVIADTMTRPDETRRLELIAYRYQPDRYERIRTTPALAMISSMTPVLASA